MSKKIIADCDTIENDVDFYVNEKKLEKQFFMFEKDITNDNCCLNSSLIIESFGTCKLENFNLTNNFANYNFYSSSTCITKGLFRLFTMLKPRNKSCLLKISYLTNCYNTKVVDNCDMNRYSCELIDSVL